MESVTRAVLRHPKRVVTIWLLLLALATGFALRLPDAVQGSSDSIEDSESGRVAAIMQKQFGPGSPYLFPVVLQSDAIRVEDPRFAAGVNAIAGALASTPGVKAVEHYWNTGARELIGRDGRAALLLVRPSVTAFFVAENLTVALRAAVARAQTGPGMTATVTGIPALFHDLNRSSSADLLRAERIGIPLALLILLIVFRSPIAALLPLVVAVIAVTLASAGLYLLSGAMPVSVFAQNAVAMIGLGVGVDYALFLVYRFRVQLDRGDSTHDAVVRASAAAGHAVLISGIAVGIGLMGLLLVNARFVHSIALGGFLVVCTAVAATLTLLPVLLLWLGQRVNWPRLRQSARIAQSETAGAWALWVAAIMRRPWPGLLLALAIVTAVTVPVFRMTVMNSGVNDLAPHFESRRGFDSLQRNFDAGWMGPLVLMIEAAPDRTLHDEQSQRAIRAMATRLRADLRVARVQIDPRVAVSADGTTALLVVVTRHGPDSAEAFEFLRALRADRWPEASQAQFRTSIGGSTAMIEDYDAELLGSLWRVIPAVLAITFIVLMLAFRSLVIPVKAIVVNLLSVMAAYGFLVLVFQDGLGASMLGINPPGGVNSLVVLMLFTILFGISMDYEVFLLRQMQEEYLRTGDNRRAVEAGVERSAGLITSAAAIMVVLFGSFGFTQFTATREFGLGLAFAVALDATLIRLLLVPAFMELFGAANWWWPGSKHPSVSNREVPQVCSSTEGVGT